ncbi:MAG TPA: hypothetical protein ENL39_03620 [Candidatus Aerophobetes bacterium]|uniref:Nickel transport protein n=1 Tax=Aerophobetes bacterium TaxID=2030807 RepID=A0A7V5HZ15_UNCAE|nr:hypothetical protein [Candidatus Aerophobetes bacterium]
MKGRVERKAFNYYKFLVSFVFSGLFLLTITSFVFAHKVNIFAYVEGDTVYTESYFSDGKKVDGGKVEVYDSQGNKLLEGETDKDGQFNFKLPKKDDLKIVLIATMGHRASYTLSKDELPDIAMMPGLKKSGFEEESKVKGSTQVDLDQVKEVIDSCLDEKLKPVMRELAKMQQKKISFTEVIGGIGYIFGITGIIFYFVGKKRG